LDDWVFEAGDYEEDDCVIICGLDYDFSYTADDLREDSDSCEADSSGMAGLA
jgi:hypothetical protein